MRFLRTLFTGEGVMSCAQAAVQADGTRLCVAGVVLVRQRPGNGNVVFCTIEDETGTANIVVWSSLLDRFRRAMLGSCLLVVTGRLQRSPEGIVHVIADRLDDRSAMMGSDHRRAGCRVCCANRRHEAVAEPGAPSPGTCLSPVPGLPLTETATVGGVSQHRHIDGRAVSVHTCRQGIRRNAGSTVRREPQATYTAAGTDDAPSPARMISRLPRRS